MRKVSLIYATLTGNTEAVAEIIKDNIEGEVELVYATDVTKETIDEADLVVFGCSTTGYGEILDDFIDLYESMDSSMLSGKKAAVFGLGDSESFPDTFCNAGVLITQKVNESGAELVADLLKIDGDYEDNEDAIVAFAKSL